jgi:N4-gp56 family major capsid protein
MADIRPNPMLIQKQWAKDLFSDVWVDQFFTKFTGSSSNSIIQTNTTLKGKGAGDRVRFAIVYKIEGNPIMDCNTLEGNEIPMDEDYMDVTIQLYRQGVRIPCMDYREHLGWINHRQLAKEQLKNWFADLFDKEIFTRLTAAPTTKRLLDEGANDLTLDMISGINEMAKMADPKIRPVRVEGKDHYVLVMHPYVARALKMSAEWKQVHQYADIRSATANKLFTGALGMWDNVILYEHENVPITGGVASNLLLGCQAGVLAESMDYFWREREHEDYGQIYKVATGTIRGFAKTKFTIGKGGTITFGDNPMTEPAHGSGFGVDGSAVVTPGDIQDYGCITVKTKAAAWA